METKEYIIDLQQYRTPGSKVFTGRPRGKKVREQSNIDDVEKKHDKITIIIPEEISSINPSFLEEFLEKVTLKLGEKLFYEKFNFVNNGKYKVVKDLEEAVERILREENALA